MIDIIQSTAIVIAFFAFLVYVVFASRFPITPSGCYFLALGFFINAILKLTSLDFVRCHTVSLLDSAVLPWLESAAYATGAILLLLQKDSFQRELGRHLNEQQQRADV